MTVYGDLVTAIEILFALILIPPFILWAYFKFNKGYFPREVKGEALVIVAGLVIPLTFFHALFSGLNDWEMGHSDLDAVVIPPFIVAWLSFVIWTTLTPSALMLIGIRLGLVKERMGPSGARKVWDYFLVWNKMLRIWAELNKWGQFSSSWASRSPYQSTPTLSIHSLLLTYCSVFLYSLPSCTFLRNVLKHPSQPISAPQLVLWNSLKWRTECKKQDLWKRSRKAGGKSWA